MKLHLPIRYRSLKVHAIVWILLPLAFMMISIIGMGFYSYQRVVTQVLINQQKQLAAVTAANVSQIIEGYTLILETVVRNNDFSEEQEPIREALLNESADKLYVFNGGLFFADKEGNLSEIIKSSSPSLLQNVAREDFFITARSSDKAVIAKGNIFPEQNQPIIVISAPIYTKQGTFHGTFLGGILLQESRLTDPIRLLVEGEQGFAYIVDHTGSVIFHPESDLVGADQSDRSYIQKVIRGESGGIIWQSPSGERLLEGYAPIDSTGWGLIVQVGLDTIAGPARTYGFFLIAAGLASFALVVLLAWWGVRLILHPIQNLSIQAQQVSSLGGIEPIPESGILEIDALEHTFSQMAGQIASYRDGMRRYVGAITQKQEEERRHIARELHDETVQSLLAISRSLELDQDAENDANRLKRLKEIQHLVSNTLTGVRQIGRELRPLVLEDLGLIPALQALVRAARLGEGAVPHVKLELPDEMIHLDPNQELAMYRITQEALNNIRKHAQATGVRISLTIEAEKIKLLIEDDGVGFQVPDSLSELAKYDQFGLMGIQERVWAVGGSLMIKSTKGEGTRLVISIPKTALL
jgi:signal transduction histidine kinase